MERSQYDPCVYTFRKGKEYGILGLYVDDLIIAGTDKTFNEKLASEIGRFVALKEKGENEPFIGIEIKKTEYGFDLSQAHYIDKILKKFALEECNIVQTPGDRDQSFDECQDSKPVDRTLYQEMIGSLMYLATGTRPDISFNLEQDTGISKTTIGKIVTKDLKLKRLLQNSSQDSLTNEQKLCRLATCENMLEMTRTDPEWIDKIITGDETWVYGYDPETKRQSAEWRGQGEPRPKKIQDKEIQKQGVAGRFFG
ncbi:hypothetical protein LAZ67_1002855 [Cordylochernes scorpioides]|uniref:Reverse transcriptase Ty1/copia-type domain-containing protein n=1 Tax=Cordylochernes scorpioides TaxID=51811 RepID=A0ABY6JXG2_9ARAC|nr:hypothetical protein LAZ67_1002855 [Cordylochernes scorpioides]